MKHRRARSLETGVNFLLLEMAEDLAGLSAPRLQLAAGLGPQRAPSALGTSVKCAAHRLRPVLWDCRGSTAAGDLGSSRSGGCVKRAGGFEEAGS